ncbi:MAG: ABC transporter ATP-binding protein [Halioglobus sp.]|nr:ABC transporter ATP-binding protein [Halioglobus sp.]
MPDQLKLHNLQVQYGDVVAIRDVSLSLQTGDIGCLLGPSGCGKTSLLRAIAGFEVITAGTIAIKDKLIASDMINIPAEHRNIGMVFQDFALFPHLTVEHNVAFGLRHLTAAEQRDRIQEMLALVGLPDVGTKFPHEISGGQQQRVALARALAPKPQLLLLDEPFSGLDEAQRTSLASEIRLLLKAQHVTALLVTHDQHEAFEMADHIALMNEGQVVQAGTGESLYQSPASPFAAKFIGEGSLTKVISSADGPPGVLQQLLNGANQLTTSIEYHVLLRPEHLVYDPSGVPLTIIQRHYRGSHYLYELSLDDGQILRCATELTIECDRGEPLPVRLTEKDLIVFR